MRCCRDYVAQRNQRSQFHPVMLVELIDFIRRNGLCPSRFERKYIFVVVVVKNSVHSILAIIFTIWR